MAWAWRFVRRPGRSSWTWPMASATSACACTFPWVLRFDDCVAPSLAMVGAAACAAGRGGLRLCLLGGGDTARHPLGIDHRRRAVQWPGARYFGNALEGFARSEEHT